VKYCKVSVVTCLLFLFSNVQNVPTLSESVYSYFVAQFVRVMRKQLLKHQIIVVPTKAE